LTSLHKILNELDKIEEEIISKMSVYEEAKHSMNQREKILKEKQDALKRKQDEKLNIELEIKEIEMKIKEEDEKIKKWEREFREAKGYREQMILMDEIREAKRVKNALEEEALKLMIKKDELEKQIANIASDIEEIIGKNEQEKEKLPDKIEEEINILHKRRNDIFLKIKELFPDVFKVFESMSNNSRWDRKIVAKLENSVCLSCNIVVLPDIEARLYMDANSFETCPNCGAILYIDWDSDKEGA
jgi:predicted  nucleic acid-binding Zn-ribbon protein